MNRFYGWIEEGHVPRTRFSRAYKHILQLGSLKGDTRIEGSLPKIERTEVSDVFIKVVVNNL